MVKVISEKVGFLSERHTYSFVSNNSDLFFILYGLMTPSIRIDKADWASVK
jgi:hypothetical protein